MRIRAPRLRFLVPTCVVFALASAAPSLRAQGAPGFHIGASGGATNVHAFVEGRYTSVTLSDLFTNSVHLTGRRFTDVVLNSGFVF